mgnify:CR=1 FL=1
MIALCYAMPGEIESLVGKDRVPDAQVAGVSFYHLSGDLVACCGGVGKVNAAMAAQLCIDRYHPTLMLGARPCWHISTSSPKSSTGYIRPPSSSTFSQ